MLVLLLALLACDDTVFGEPVGGLSDGGSSDGGGTGEVPTWNADVLQIVEANCLGCHVDGGIGPFPLETWAQAAPLAAAMAGSVSTGSMPPWPPSADCNTYIGERGLNAEQIATLVAWSEGGAPEGDAATIVHADLPKSTLGEPDLEISLPEPYTPVNSPDDYRCFLLDVTTPQDLYLTAFAVDPDQDAIVHHVIAYLVEPTQIATYQALDDADSTPGWECFGGPGGDDALSWLGGWVPGSLGDPYPAGTGLKVPAGSTAVVQMHYFVGNAGPLEDQTTLRFWAQADVEKEARLVKVLDPRWPAGNMPITAGDSDATYTVELENPLGQSALLWAAGPHMHLLGKSSSLRVNHSDLTETCVVDIPDWDFGWQGNYFLEAPIEVGADDTVTLECHFDASNATSDLNWGEGSEDEMCLSLVYATLAD